jgi:chromosome segregation ATPase
MGRNMKSAKNQLRMINKDGDGLLSRVSKDMKALESTLRDDLTERVSNMDDGLLELAKLRDAISAGLSETRRELERVHKRLGKANADISKAKDSILGVAEKLGESRQLYGEMRDQLEKVIHQPPTSIELVQQAVQGLLRASSIWEGDAQGIEDRFANVVDCSIPSEIKELESDLLGNGYSVLLAGNQRDETKIAQIDEQLIELMGSEPRSS